MVNVSGRTQQGKATKKRSGFVYVPRSAESVKARAERKGGRFDSPFKPGFDQWRAKEGDNLIRILQPTWEGFDHYAYRIWTHRYVGPDKSTYLCPLKMKNKSCPICEAARAAQNAGEDDEYRALRPSEQFLAWILDRDDDDPTVPKLWAMSWTMDRDIANLVYSKRTGEILLIDHPDEGFDLTIKRSGNTMKNTKYFGLMFDRQPTPIADSEKDREEILEFIHQNPLPSVLQFHDADYLDKVISGTSESADEDLDEEKDTSQDYDHEEEEVRADKKARARRPVDEEDEDEDEAPRRSHRTRDEEEEDTRADVRSARRREEEDDDEEEDVKPKRRRAAAEEEDDEDEDVRPKSRRRAAAAEEEDDEDERPKAKKKRAAAEEEDDEKAAPDEEEYEEDDEEEEEPAPKRARGGNGRVRPRQRDPEPERATRRPVRQAERRPRRER